MTFPAAMETTPVFIGGAGRSGTTLLVDMLGMHPAISPVYETDFVLQVAEILFGSRQIPIEQTIRQIHLIMDQWTGPLPRRPHNKRAHERYHHGPHYILFDRQFAMAQTEKLIGQIELGNPRQGFASLILELFGEHTRKDGKTRWVNKTPSYVLALPMLRDLFPNLRFIHCVRDGRDTACSAMTRPWGPKTIEEAASWWVANVSQGIQFGRQFPAQCLLVKYEDLIIAPEAALARVLSWLDENPGDAGKIVQNYQSGTVQLEQVRIGQWQRELSDDQKRAFRELAGQTLIDLGYGD